MHISGRELVLSKEGCEKGTQTDSFISQAHWLGISNSILPIPVVRKKLPSLDWLKLSCCQAETEAVNCLYNFNENARSLLMLLLISHFHFNNQSS